MAQVAPCWCELFSLRVAESRGDRAQAIRKLPRIRSSAAAFLFFRRQPAHIPLVCLLRKFAARTVGFACGDDRASICVRVRVSRAFVRPFIRRTEWLAWRGGGGTTGCCDHPFRYALCCNLYACVPHSFRASECSVEKETSRRCVARKEINQLYLTSFELVGRL